MAMGVRMKSPVYVTIILLNVVYMDACNSPINFLHCDTKIIDFHLFLCSQSTSNYQIIANTEIVLDKRVYIVSQV